VELEAFVRRNVAAASEKTTDAIAEQGAARSEQLASRTDVERSGHAMRINADRAKTVKACSPFLFVYSEYGICFLERVWFLYDMCLWCSTCVCSSSRF
jgi:hypothetical protein